MLRLSRSGPWYQSDRSPRPYPGRYGTEHSRISGRLLCTRLAPVGGITSHRISRKRSRRRPPCAIVSIRCLATRPPRRRNPGVRATRESPPSLEWLARQCGQASRRPRQYLNWGECAGGSSRRGRLVPLALSVTCGDSSPKGRAFENTPLPTLVGSGVFARKKCFQNLEVRPVLSPYI